MVSTAFRVMAGEVAAVDRRRQHGAIHHREEVLAAALADLPVVG